MKRPQMMLKMPPGLDREAKRKFRELVQVCDPDTDTELVESYARQYSLLVSVRSERAKQEAAKIFSTMVAGRDGTQVLNPLLVAENRAIAALNRMLRTLGLAPSREEQGRRRPVSDADEVDPLEAGLCRPYGFTSIRIWREIRQGKTEIPTTALEKAEFEADRLEAERRLETWKASHGICVEDGPIRAPEPNASREEWSAYNDARNQWIAEIDGAIRRAGLDPRNQ